MVSAFNLLFIAQIANRIDKRAKETTCKYEWNGIELNGAKSTECQKFCARVGVLVFDRILALAGKYTLL